MVGTSVFFEIKIVLPISNASFASPCKTKFLLLSFGHSSMRIGEAFPRGVFYFPMAYKLL